MPRYHVVAVDTDTREIRGYITRTDSESVAICNHPWLTYVYNNVWIAKHIYDDDVEVVKNNLNENVGWVVLCVNLDEEIMNDLNAGDSSVSSPAILQS